MKWVKGVKGNKLLLIKQILISHSEVMYKNGDYINNTVLHISKLLREQILKNYTIAICEDRC